MYQRHELLAALSPEDFSASLAVCGLADKDEYTDDEGDNFQECRSLISQGKSYDEVALLLLQNGFVPATVVQSTEVNTHSKAKKSSKGKKPALAMDFNSLRTWVSEEVSAISPIELAHIIQACSLPDQKEYAQDECERVLCAAQMLKKQSKTYTEVAAHFSKTTGEEESDLVQQVERVVSAMESQASELTDELLQQRAESQALTDAQRYMLHYAKAAASGEQVQEFWARLRDHAKARLAGKPQARFMRAEPQTTLILPSSPNSMNSSENSENGTNAE